jgi:hypothetical protein
VSVSSLISWPQESGWLKIDHGSEKWFCLSETMDLKLVNSSRHRDLIHPLGIEFDWTRSTTRASAAGNVEDVDAPVLAGARDDFLVAQRWIRRSVLLIEIVAVVLRWLILKMTRHGTEVGLFEQR